MTELASNTFVVTYIEENEDGSANIEVEAGPEMQKMFCEEGLVFLLLKGVLEGKTEDILRWAERGKQEERTDSLVENFGEIYNEDTK